MIIEIDENIEDFLEHHGVKGQKWGQRKPRSQAQMRARHKAIKKSATTGLVVGVVGIAATLAIGKAVTGSFLNSNGHMAVKAITQ